jgi:predicted transcriptional regulator
MATAVLNVKIDDALKERLRHYAEVNNENLSVTTEKLLLLAFEAVEEAGVSEEDIDNQHTEERMFLHLLLKKSRLYVNF